MIRLPCLPFELITEATLLVVHLHAIGAVVDPAGVGMAHDHHVAGADVVAAVVLVPSRRRDLEQVDVVAACRRSPAAAPLAHRAPAGSSSLLHVVAPVAHQFHVGGVGRQAERQIDAPGRGEDVGEHAVAARIARNVVEQHRRRCRSCAGRCRRCRRSPPRARRRARSAARPPLPSGRARRAGPGFGALRRSEPDALSARERVSDMGFLRSPGAYCTRSKTEASIRKASTVPKMT